MRQDQEAGVPSTLLDGTDVNLRGVPLDFTFLVHAFCNSMLDNEIPGGGQEYKLGMDHLGQMVNCLDRGEIDPRWVEGAPQPTISLKVPKFENPEYGISGWCRWEAKHSMSRRDSPATDDEWMAVEKRLKLFEWRTNHSRGTSKLYWCGPRATLTFLKLVLGGT